MEKKALEIFDASTIDQLEWPETEEGKYAKNFLFPLVKEGLSPYFENIKADIYALKIDDLVLPVVVASENYNNSYVCSPYGHFVGCGKQEVENMPPSLMSKSAKTLLNTLGKLVQASSMNSVVFINNWLFSTDIYPQALQTGQVDHLVSFLKRKFPKHALCFRSLNGVTTPSLFSHLKKEGFRPIPTRHIFLTDTKKESIFKTRILKSDLKLWKAPPFEIKEERTLTTNECQEILSLYRSLYIEQHSTFHPHPTLELVKMMLEKRVFHFKVLRIEGKIRGVAAYFVRNGTLMCPFLGLDKTHPSHNLIYRLLSISLLVEARQNHLMFHQGAGASFYKSIRRAEGCLESMAVYASHLPWKQRVSWAFFAKVLNFFAPRYMKKH